MRSLAENQDVAALHKMPTGVEGFDAITGGGLPRNRTTPSSAVRAAEKPCSPCRHWSMGRANSASRASSSPSKRTPATFWQTLEASGGTSLNWKRSNYPFFAEGYGFMQFMADCVVALKQRVVDQIALRYVQVIKYRGSSFAENEAPLVIGASGMEVADISATTVAPETSHARASSGVERLDAMLGGGYFRGSSVLITGSAGTGKSILAGAFAEAACLRKERTLYVSFDENPSEVVRDLSSVGLRLGPHVKSGVLRMHSARAEASSAEVHLMKIKAIVREHQSRCMVVDPLSAIVKAGGALTAGRVAERLICLAKSEGITLVSTSLLQGAQPLTEETPVQISTIADTWVHLTNISQAGERNRALSIVKSRGMKNSNQVRELILSDQGIALADVYTAAGDVLMGTARWQKEAAENLNRNASLPRWSTNGAKSRWPGRSSACASELSSRS